MLCFYFLKHKEIKTYIDRIIDVNAKTLTPTYSPSTKSQTVKIMTL